MWRSVISEIVREGQRAIELRKDVADPVAVAKSLTPSLEERYFPTIGKACEALCRTVGKHLDGYLRSLSRT